MTERPMHAIPGAFQKLQQLYMAGYEANQAQEYEKAVALFTEGIELDDHFRHQYVTMYARRAFPLARLGRREEAIADLTKAIEMEPDFNHAAYYLQRGTFQLELGKTEEALEDGKRGFACGEGEQTWALLLLIGQTCSFLGQKSTAIEAFEGAYERVKNESTQAGMQKATELKLELGRHAQAAVAAGAAGDADPEVFPGQPVAKLSDYVAIMKKMQTGDMQGALAPYGLDMVGYATVAAQWAGKLGADPVLNAKFMKLLTGG